MQSIMIIVKKELKRVFSDKRLLFTNFILPMVSIAIMYSVMGMMIKGNFEDSESHKIRLLTENAPPAFEKILATHKKFIIVKKDETVNVNVSLLNNHYDMYIDFDTDFEAKLIDYKSNILPTVTTMISPKNEYLSEVKFAVDNVLNQYKQTILAKRLGGKGFLEVFNYTQSEITVPKNKKGIEQIFANLIPMLITIFVFAGAMGTGMDTFAGEKERGTMATMLVTPVSRNAIIIGKMISLAIISLLSMTSSLIGVAVSIPFSKTIFAGPSKVDAVSFSIAPIDVLWIALCLLGLVMIFVTIISAVSMYAKNLKEAGTYVSPIYMVIMVMAFSTMFSGNKVKGYQLYTPIMNNITNMKMILSGDGNLLNIAVALLTSVIFASIVIIVMRKMIYKEKIVFPE